MMKMVEHIVKQSYNQSDKQMDSTDALSHPHCCINHQRVP